MGQKMNVKRLHIRIHFLILSTELPTLHKIAIAFVRGRNKLDFLIQLRRARNATLFFNFSYFTTLAKDLPSGLHYLRQIPWHTRDKDLPSAPLHIQQTAIYTTKTTERANITKINQSDCFITLFPMFSVYSPDKIYDSFWNNIKQHNYLVFQKRNGVLPHFKTPRSGEAEKRRSGEAEKRRSGEAEYL